MSLILFSPCKEMNLERGHLQPVMSPQTASIIAQLQPLDSSDLQSLFRVSKSQAAKVYQFYQDIHSPRSRPAYQVYQGLAYRQFDWERIDLDFAKKHLVILSALYGPITPLDPINPYRLDLTVPIRVKEQALRTYWKETVNQYVKDRQLINLASQEFASLLDLKKHQILQVKFLADRSSFKKVPSATAKKLRGALANHLLQQNHLSAKHLETFHFSGYAYDPDLSSENHAVFALQ